MRRLVVKRLALAALLLGARSASAGPIADLIRERRAERAERAAQGGTGGQGGAAEGGLDDGSGASPGANGAKDAGVRLPDGARLERDLAYGPDPRHRLDLYRPASAGAGTRAPVVFYVHGGGWRIGDKGMARMVDGKMQHFLGKGALFVSTNYRLLPQAGVLEQADDVARALAWVQAHAAEHGGDPSRVLVVGHSAGAHLVALMTADGAIATRQGVRPWLATVALDSAALDMVAIMNRRHYRFYDSVFGTDPEFWRAASPTHRLQGRPAAPMLMVCSSQRDDSCPPAREFAAKANRLGGRVEVLPVALNHRQINEQLGASGEYTRGVEAFLKAVGAG